MAPAIIFFQLRHRAKKSKGACSYDLCIIHSRGVKFIIECDISAREFVAPEIVCSLRECTAKTAFVLYKKYHRKFYNVRIYITYLTAYSIIPIVRHRLIHFLTPRRKNLEVRSLVSFGGTCTRH